MSNTSEMTTIEINGVKMEVDLRHARRIDELRVGDRVKVLIKQYSDYAVYPGTIVGFEPFQKLPTIIVAYVKNIYSDSGISFCYFNSETKETEIVKAIDDDQLDINKADVLADFDKKTDKLNTELNEIAEQRRYFLAKFATYWERVEGETA